MIRTTSTYRTSWKRDTPDQPLAQRYRDTRQPVTLQVRRSTRASASTELPHALPRTTTSRSGQAGRGVNRRILRATVLSGVYSPPPRTSSGSIYANRSTTRSATASDQFYTYLALKSYQGEILHWSPDLELGTVETKCNNRERIVNRNRSGKGERSFIWIYDPKEHRRIGFTTQEGCRNPPQ